MRAVVDTNALVSALIGGPDAPPAVILRAVWANEFEIVLSEALIEELAAVITRQRLLERTGWGAGDAIDFVQSLAEVAVLAAPTAHLSVLADDPDNRLLEAAIAAEADYVVSGDKPVRALGAYEGVRIVTPAQFQALLAADA